MSTAAIREQTKEADNTVIVRSYLVHHGSSQLKEKSQVIAREESSVHKDLAIDSNKYQSYGSLVDSNRIFRFSYSYINTKNIF